MIRLPDANSWGYQTGNTITTRPPGGGALGTSITPGNNTYGSYVSILAGGSIAYDCYWVEINFNSNAVSTAARDTIVTIGVDPSGGTSYTDLIPNLLCSSASPFGNLQNGFWYTFPLFVKAGSQLAAKASVNNGTVGTLRVGIKLYGQPSRPDAIWWGSSVESIGINSGTSNGTDVTSGTTSEGTWTSLGTSAKRCCYWQLGAGLNNSAMSNFQYHLDISAGDASNKTVILQDIPATTTTAETMSLQQGPGWFDVPEGTNIYGRGQCSSSPAQTINMAAYGVRP